MPNILSILIYIKIKKRLSKLKHYKRKKSTVENLSDNINTQVSKSENQQTSNIQQVKQKKKLRIKETIKERKLLVQFILINFVESLSATSLVFLIMGNFLKELGEKFYCIRQIFRITNLTCQTCIPVFSLASNSAEFCFKVSSISKKFISQN